MRRDTPPDRAGYLWGVRLGLAVFVVGSLLGFVLVANRGHSVPGPDGGPGCRSSTGRWTAATCASRTSSASTRCRPCRCSASCSIAPPPHRRLRLTTVAGVAVAWLVVAGVTLVLALAGRPLITL